MHTKSILQEVVELFSGELNTAQRISLRAILSGGVQGGAPEDEPDDDLEDDPKDDPPKDKTKDKPKDDPAPGPDRGELVKDLSEMKAANERIEQKLAGMSAEDKKKSKELVEELENALKASKERASKLEKTIEGYKDRDLKTADELFEKLPDGVRKTIEPLKGALDAAQWLDTVKRAKANAGDADDEGDDDVNPPNYRKGKDRPGETGKRRSYKPKYADMIEDHLYRDVTELPHLQYSEDRGEKRFHMHPKDWRAFLLERAGKGEKMTTEKAREILRNKGT